MRSLSTAPSHRAAADSIQQVDSATVVAVVAEEVAVVTEDVAVTEVVSPGTAEALVTFLERR